MMSELCGKGWTVVDPPKPYDEDSVIARYNGEPIRAGVLMEDVEDSEDVSHLRFRSGSYDVSVKLDLTIGRGQVKVEQAEGYDDV